MATTVISPIRSVGSKDIRELAIKLDRFQDQVASVINPVLKTQNVNWIYIGQANNPAFQNSWANFGVPFCPARFFKDSNGVVHLAGLVKGGTPAFAITACVFTLPSGYRPLYSLLFGVTSSLAAFGEIRIGSYSKGALGTTSQYAGGDVTVVSGSSSYTSLDGISFLAEQ